MRPAEAEAPVPAVRPRRVAGGSSGRLVVALGVYVALAAACMLSGFGGEAVARYVGLVADLPPNLVALYLTVTAARRAGIRGVRFAWWSMAAALALYFVGSVTASAYWFADRDPFPGPADLFFLAFYGPLFAAVLALTRAAAVRVPWARLTLDGTIFVAGFGAFFWYLVIRPATHAAELDVVKQVLSQVYVGLNCLLLLAFGVLLLAGGGTIRRRIPLLLTAGYAMMFVGDILWSLGKVAGDYLPGGLQDVMYVACYLPLAAAAREQLRGHTDATGAGADGNALVPGLPYAAMLVSLLVLVYFGRGDVSDPATIMTIVVFGLMLLMMLRQGVIMRDEALAREQRAASLVEARYASLIANASDVIMIASADGALRFASPAAERTFGMAPAVMERGNLLDLWRGEPRERATEFLAEVAASHGSPVGPVELQFDRGDERCTLEAVGSNLADDPAVRALALNFRDITERKTLEEQLRRLAFHDSLTLLANRNLFRDRVQHALVLAQRAGQRIAVMFLDLDNFKNVNDTLGHDSGDRLLQAAAQRLLKCTRSSDTVARLGGDEFAILLEGVDATADTEQVAARAIESLAEPFTLGGSEVRVAASLGLAYSTATEGAEELLRNADIAMYNAKARGKDRYVIFQPEMQEVLRERLRMEEEIGRALATGEFFLEYQPIVDLGSRGLLGVEALVRWRHPDRGIVMPGQFIQVAEESGQIVPLGRWVLLEACRSVRVWRDSIAGGAGLRVAVNISGRHLQHADLVGDVAGALRETGLEPANLVIELTESTIMNNTDANLERLHQLKALGVRLAIDDFGTGYSSLSYLHRFPIDILKIDRSFVSRLISDDDGPELARAVVRLGDTLGLDTVAEGVESEQQVAALLDLGCVAAQGFLFSASTSLDSLSASAFAARRRVLWEATCDAQSPLSATGRFPALIAAGRNG